MLLLFQFLFLSIVSVAQSVPISYIPEILIPPVPGVGLLRAAGHADGILRHRQSRQQQRPVELLPQQQQLAADNPYGRDSPDKA